MPRLIGVYAGRTVILLVLSCRASNQENQGDDSDTTTESQSELLHEHDTLRNRNGPGQEKTCFMSYANKKGADQPAHPRSLISAFAFRCLDSVMSLVSVTKISSLMLASVAEQAILSLTLSETPKDMFSHDEAQIVAEKVIEKYRVTTR